MHDVTSIDKQTKLSKYKAIVYMPAIIRWKCFCINRVFNVFLVYPRRNAKNILTTFERTYPNWALPKALNNINLHGWTSHKIFQYFATTTTFRTFAPLLDETILRMRSGSHFKPLMIAINFSLLWSHFSIRKVSVIPYLKKAVVMFK